MIVRKAFPGSLLSSESTLTARFLSRLSAYNNLKSCSQCFVPSIYAQHGTFLRHNSTKLGRPEGLPLRDYQQECIEECLITIKKGYRRFAVSMPTGSGKTRTFYGLLEAISRGGAHSGHGKKWLILAHREELITQAYDHAKRLFPDLKTSMEMGKHTADPDADIIVASVQSISREKRLERFDGSDFSAIVIDEAHHAPAASYAKVLNHLGANNPDSEIVVAGFSATLSRMDGLALGSTFDYIAYHKDLSEMIKNGYLTDIKFTTIATDVDLTGVKKARGDFATGSLSKAVDTPALNELVYKAWKRQSGKHSLIFGVNIEHVSNLALTFRENGIDAHVVTSDTPRDLRRGLVEDFRNGHLPVLINCGIFTEGTDIPNIDTVILVRPTRSAGLLMQMIGRGLRLHPGKEVCHIIDMFGSSSNANALATVPTLAGLDPSQVRVIDKAEIANGVSRPRVVASSKDPDSVYVEDFDNLDDFLNRNGGKLNTSAISRSRLNWIPSGQNNFLLFGKEGYLRLCPDANPSKLAPKYSLIQYFENPFREDNRGAKYLRKYIFESMPDFNAAVNAAELFARQNCPYHLVAKNVPWRSQPCTINQEKAVMKLFTKVVVDGDEEGMKRAKTICKDLTKGQSANIINLASIGNKSILKDMLYPKKEKKSKADLFEFLQAGPVNKLEIKLSQN
ncbi:Irc3p [Sugiyamaella lignohabitans]|uniref:Irc3p n=1 Tax=Sugiyamaella lignohabitans TaxID=796027 RepID=A0A167CNX5_9ASCO|nr:Irc3p [Sugiyamaella lignohabitans]ANB11939.1 Irc3p [Sugiyamaella lignohabitans]